MEIKKYYKQLCEHKFKIEMKWTNSLETRSYKNSLKIK